MSNHILSSATIIKIIIYFNEFYKAVCINHVMDAPNFENGRFFDIVQLKLAIH